MQIGIVVFSHTGNTRSVVDALATRLEEEGHEASVLALRPRGAYRPGDSSAELDEVIDPRPFDRVVFATPVHAFSLPAISAAYFAQLDDLEGVEMVGLVTQALPFASLGATRTLGQIAQRARERGARYLGGASISWSKRRRADRIEAALDRLVGLLTR